MSLNSRINAWGSVSDLHACVGFRGNKKVEKHRILHVFWALMKADNLVASFITKRYVMLAVIGYYTL